MLCIEYFLIKRKKLFLRPIYFVPTKPLENFVVECRYIIIKILSYYYYYYVLFSWITRIPRILPLCVKVDSRWIRNVKITNTCTYTNKLAILKTFICPCSLVSSYSASLFTCGINPRSLSLLLSPYFKHRTVFSSLSLSLSLSRAPPCRLVYVVHTYTRTHLHAACIPRCRWWRMCASSQFLFWPRRGCFLLRGRARAAFNPGVRGLVISRSGLSAPENALCDCGGSVREWYRRRPCIDVSAARRKRKRPGKARGRPFSDTPPAPHPFVFFTGISCSRYTLPRLDDSHVASTSGQRAALRIRADQVEPLRWALFLFFRSEIYLTVGN